MKIFLCLLLLGLMVFFMVRRAEDYGLPWEDQVVISGVETNKLRRGGSEQLYVRGEIRNMTRKPMQAVIDCKSLPPGRTLSPKVSTTVDLQPEEGLPFTMQLKSNRNATGADCKVKDWSVPGGVDEKAYRSVRRLFYRLRAGF